MSDFGDSLDHVPSSWSPSRGDESVPYSIESILPPGRRRFLQLREPFLLLTGMSPTRAAVLECSLFELSRVMTANSDGELRSLEWREEQFAILTGPDPESCDLWAPVSNELILDRLMGIARDESTIRRAFADLEKRGYVFRRRLGGYRNDRLVLPNIRKINYDQRDLAAYAGRKFKSVVTGSPDQLIEVPEKVVFTPLYEGLKEIAEYATGLGGMDLVRCALVLQRILHRAKLRFQEGEEVPARWTVRGMLSTFGWGRRDNWKSAMNTLIASKLVINHERTPEFVLEPNLPLIHALSGTDCPLEPKEANVPTPPGESNHTTGQKDPYQWADVTGAPGKKRNTGLLKGSEVFPESLTEYLSEREPAADFVPSEILGAHSVEPFRERRDAHFAFVDVKPEWSSLTFDKLAEADEKQAAALLELANKMPTGERPAICFRNNTDLSRALVSVVLGHWIDEHVGTGFRWVNVDDYVKTIAAEFSESRSREIARVEKPTGPLVIENVAQARKHEQARDSLSAAIKEHREALMPIIFLGLPPRLSDLSSSLKGHKLADQIYRVLRERNRPVDHETGLDISNPFTELL